MTKIRDNPLLEGHTDRAGLAEIFDVTTRTICRWEKLEDGGLPRIILGGRVIYNIESVKRWIAKREHSISPPAATGR
jgi:phage terminase Nu1 subunit (DNA packaging protein)